MVSERRRILLFLVCAAVLLGAGFGWGYANAYDHFYSPDATLDRETVRLDFDTRILRHINAGQRDECRRELLTQLRQQTAFLKGVVSGAQPETRADATRKLEQAEAAMAWRPAGAERGSEPEAARR